MNILHQSNPQDEGGRRRTQAHLKNGPLRQFISVCIHYPNM